MALPLLLTGPILRRVEPTLVSVWVALSQPASVRLSVWDGRVIAGSDAPLIAGPAGGTRTLRIGDKLHIALAVLKVPNNSAQTLRPGHIYSYDIEIAVDGQTPTETLASLHMLDAGVVDGQLRVPLGYEPGFLPGFALPPAELENLRIVFGSCRRVAHPDPDAMVWIDDIIESDQAFKDPVWSK